MRLPVRSWSPAPGKRSARPATPTHLCALNAGTAEEVSFFQEDIIGTLICSHHLKMNVEMANDTTINTSDDQGSSVAAPATEVNLEHSTSSIVDDLTEDPSAAGSVPPPSTAFHVPWRASTPPQVLSVRTFADNHGTVIRNNINGSENLEGNMQMGSRQNSYHDDEDEEISEPLTPQMTSSSRNYTSYHNRLTPKIMGGAAPSLTSSTRSVKSNSSSIVGHYFPDALNMPPSSTLDEIHDTPSIRSDLAGWVIDAPKNATESNLIENEHQQRGVPLIVVEKQPTHSRMSIRSHSHHGSNGSGSGMGGMNSSMLGLRKAIQDVQVKLERSLKDMQESNTRDLERCMYQIPLHPPFSLQSLFHPHQLYWILISPLLVITVIQQESNKRISSLENRLHAQLLAQSETMVAMELKLLRLESKVERREAMILSQQQRRRAYSYPLAATAIDEEGDIRSDDPNSHLDDGSLETMPPEIQVQKNDNNTSNSQSLRMNGNSGWVNTVSGSMTGPRNNVLGGSSTSNTAHNFQSSSAHNPRAQPSNPRNVAIISSGASLTSAFTATSFLDGEGSTQMDTAYDIGVEGEEGMVSVRSGEGDYDDDEEEVVDEEEFNDGSASSTLEPLYPI
jgi:hypothetical protein